MINKISLNSALYKIRLYILFCLALFPLMNYAISSITIISFTVVSIFLFITTDQRQVPWKILIINTLFVLLLFLSLLYSDDSSRALTSIVHQLSLIVIPLSFFLLPNTITKRNVQTFLLIFLLGNIILILLLLINFYNLDYFSTANFKRVTSRFLFRKELYTFLGASYHPTYLSMWLSFSIFIGLNFLYETKNNYKKSLLIFCSFIFFLAIIILQSRIIFVSTIFIIPLFLLFKEKRKRSRIKLLFVFLTIFLFLSIFINSKPPLKRRFIDSAKGLVSDEHSHLTRKRVVINSCSYELFLKKPLIGYGLGDVNAALQSCYQKTSVSKIIKGFNSHNNYFHLLLAGGLITLLAFLLMYLYNFNLAYANHNFLYLSFLLLIGIAMLTENILSRNHGIVFFSIFNSLFFYRIKLTKI